MTIDPDRSRGLAIAKGNHTALLCRKGTAYLLNSQLNPKEILPFPELLCMRKDQWQCLHCNSMNQVKYEYCSTCNRSSYEVSDDQRFNTTVPTTKPSKEAPSARGTAWAFILLTLCMTLIGALLVIPMTSLALEKPISLKHFTVGIMLLPFTSLFALPIAAHFSIITIAAIYITDRFIPLREKLKNKLSQRAVSAVLTMLALPLHFCLTWILSGSTEKSSDIESFIFQGAIPAAISAAALGPLLISNICKKTSNYTS